MKYIFSILLFAFSFALTAQETTTTLEQTSATTFLQTNVTTHADGRIVTEQIPYDIGEFANLVIEQNISNLIGIDQREAANTLAQRDVNQLKRFLIDSLSIDYDSLMSEKLLVALEGDWKFIERSGQNTTTNVSIDRHNSNATFLRMKNEDAAGAWNLKSIHTQKFEIRNYLVSGVGETVELSLTQFNNFTGYRGKASDGTVLILRR